MLTAKLVQRQGYRHASPCRGGRIDVHLSAGKAYGHSHKAQSHAGVPANHGCRHIETSAVIGHFELNAVAHALGDAAQPDRHSRRLSEFIDITEELLRRPVQKSCRLPVYFHPVVRSLQVHCGSAFAEGKGQTVNCAGYSKSMEVDRVCISEDATYGDDFIA